MSYIVRGLASIIIIAAYGWINALLNPVSTVLTGEAAVKQLQNSDTAYVTSTWLMNIFSHIGVPSIVLLVVLVAIWWGPLKRGWAAISALALLAALFAVPQHAYAYWDKHDYAEAIYILPNQSAFLIPDVGANKNSQAQFMSLEYLKEIKVASKRVAIPHVELTGSGYWDDYYVPAARVIIVPRPPYNREWVTSKERGTSAKNEGIPCQSSEGLNITTGISIGVSIREENAATYLYYFGTENPKGDPSKPEVIFTSVFYARSVENVMDSVGHGEALSLVCAELNAHTLNEDNLKASEIMGRVKEKMAAYLAERGITLDYMGWADTFGFDDPVQKSINDKYIANTVLPVLPTLQALADIRIKEGLGKGIADHGLPANLVAIPTDLLNFTGLFTKMAGPTPSAGH